VAAAGAAGLYVLSPLTTNINYSSFEPDGSIDVRLTYDHRVLDGSMVARTLVALEEVLRGAIRDELLASAE
jgi:pyruvate/2-oxoglutarate dehydrogenase complex dihydrolipoamide acyltransferase (E2) component